MGDNSNPFLLSSPPPPPSSSTKSNLPMLYYGLVIVGTAAIVLAIYNLIIIKWCAHRRGSPSNRDTRFVEIMRASNQPSFESSNRSLLSSFTYKKDVKKKSNKQEEEGGEYECAVCLSAFEEGDEVRELPRCSHSFHAPCIDMWLYSHYDCPLCRALVNPPPVRHSHRHMLPATPENSQEGLLLSGNISV